MLFGADVSVFEIVRVRETVLKAIIALATCIVRQSVGISKQPR